MAEVYGAREAAIAKELTKLHESVARGIPAALAAAFDSTELKGEFVVLVGPPAATKLKSATTRSWRNSSRPEAGKLSRRRAQRRREDFKVKRSRVYELGLTLERKGSNRP